MSSNLISLISLARYVAESTLAVPYNYWNLFSRVPEGIAYSHNVTLSDSYSISDFIKLFLKYAYFEWKDVFVILAIAVIWTILRTIVTSAARTVSLLSMSMINRKHAPYKFTLHVYVQS